MDCGDGYEREARFLVAKDWRTRAMGALSASSEVSIGVGERLEQWYLTTDPARVVRVRRSDRQVAWLTIKGKKVGDTAPEYEFELPGPMDKVEGLRSLRVGSVITKVRYPVKVDEDVIEVDEFEGDNAGLILAEIEYCDPPGLARPDEIPDWLGEEITQDHRYSNLRLAQTPFRNWE